MDSRPSRDILERLMALWQEPWSEPAFGEAQMLLSRLRALPSERPSDPWPGTRLILATDELLQALASYTEDGRRITFQWGEPDEHGWYAPTFTVQEPTP